MVYIFMCLMMIFLLLLVIAAYIYFASRNGACGFARHGDFFPLPNSTLAVNFVMRSGHEGV